MSVKKVGRDCYEVRCRYDGKSFKRRFEDKWQAIEFERLVQTEKVDPDRAAYRASGFDRPVGAPRIPTFRDFVYNTWLPAKLTGDATGSGAPVSEATAYYCKNQIKTGVDLVGSERLDELTKGHFLEVKRQLLMEPLNTSRKSPRIYARASANKILKRMKECMRYAEEMQLIDKSPWSALRSIPLEKKDKVHWRMNECRRFLETVRKRDHGHYAFFTIALTYGLRRSELFGLQLGDVDFENNEIKVQRQWDEFHYSRYGQHSFKAALKNGRPSKTLPLTAGVREALEKQCKLMVGPATQLFPFPAQYIKNTRALIDRYAEAAGVPSISLHKMRDSFIANMSREGVNEAIIAAIAGCSKENLKHYQQFDSRDARRALTALNFE